MHKKTSELPNNIRKLRLARGYSQEELADMVGVTKDQISKLERGVRSLRQDYIMKISHALYVEPHQLLPSKRKSPVIGQVSGDGEIQLFQDNNMGFAEIDSPPGEFSESLVAVDVEDDSMLPFIKPSWKIFYEQTQGQTHIKAIGNLCAVKLNDGRLLIRELHKTDTPSRFNLTSYNDDNIENTKIDWATPIVYIKPKI